LSGTLDCWEKDVFGRKRRRPPRHQGAKVLSKSAFLVVEKKEMPQRHRGTVKSPGKKDFLGDEKKEKENRFLFTYEFYTSRST
jgi:hypothetical protein